MDILIIVWIVYGVISVLLMLCFIVVFGANKRFDNSFYRVVQCDQIMNLCCYLNSWIHRLAQRPQTGYLLQNFPPIIFTITAYTTFFFFQTQSASIILLCFYRYSLLKFENANKFWKKWCILVYFGVILLYSIVLMLPIFAAFHPLVYDGAVGFFVDAPEFAEYRYTYGAYLWFCCVTYFIIIITLGLRTVFELRKRFAQHQNDSRTRDVLMRITIIVAINTVVYMLIIWWMLTIGIFVPDIDRVLQNELVMTVSDTLSFSMPYTLLLCDKKVQEMISQKIPIFYRNPSSVVAPIS